MRLYRVVALAFSALFLAGPPSEGQTPAQANVCFLSATFHNGGEWPARVYCLDASGTLRLVREVAAGVHTVLADYDRRVLVIASPALDPHLLAIVDMSAPAVERHVTIDYDAKEVFLQEAHLLDVPARGMWVAMALGKMSAAGIEAAKALTAVSLDAKGASSVETLPLADLAGVRLSGYVGGALELYAQQVPYARGDPLSILFFGIPQPTGIPRPPYIKPSADPREDLYLLDAVNDALVVSTPELPWPPPHDVIDIFDRRLGLWHRTKTPFPVSRVRAFGPWVAAIATEPRSGAEPAVRRTSINMSEIHSLRSSPGQVKRTAEVVDPHTNIDDLFDELPEYFPGDLFVANGRTGSQFTIHTGEGDSEVILATDAAVYYRVNDALFRADLVSGKLATGVKIAEGPDVPQAHWAFLGPPVN